MLYNLYLGLTIGHGFKSWGDTASWSLFGLIYTAIKNSLSRLQPLQGISYECFCVNERKIFFKKSHQKLTWERVEPTTLWLPDHCSTIFTISFSYNWVLFFLLVVSHAQICWFPFLLQMFIWYPTGRHLY